MTSYYPVSLDVRGKRCVVVGGGEVAERKVIALLEADALVVVVSPDLTSDLRRLRDTGGLEHVARRYQEGDLSGAFLAVAATNDEVTNDAVSVAARGQGILVNVVDDPTRCDFTLPAVLRRGDLLIAVSTGGRSPAVARRMREELEAFLTPERLALLEVAAEVRAELRQRGRRASGEAWRQALDGELRALIDRGDRGAARARLIARLMEQPLDQPAPVILSEQGGVAGGGGEAKNLPAPSPHKTRTEEILRLRSATAQNDMFRAPLHEPVVPSSRAGKGEADEPAGMVSLVGAGPGDPGLITVRGLERLREAEVVVYDRLVDERLLAEAPPEAALIYVGKVASRHTLRQTEINALLVNKAREGKRVVRLKGGDPFVFGRGAEEAQDLAAAGIPFEVVPGITSAVAAPAYAGIPVTHRRYASSFVVITGHEDPTKPVSEIAWEKLATGVGTIVCLMSVENLPHIVEQVLRHGRAPETPVALIRWGTWPAQETLTGTLADIVERAEAHNFGPPAVAVIGEVVRLRECIRWFDQPERPTLMCEAH